MTRRKNTKTKIRPRKPQADNSPNSTNITNDKPVSVSDIAQAMINACASVGKDGAGDRGLEGWLQVCAIKHRSQMLEALTKFRAADLRDPLSRNRFNPSHGAVGRYDNVRFANPREELLARILLIQPATIEGVAEEAEEAQS